MPHPCSGTGSSSCWLTSHRLQTSHKLQTTTETTLQQKGHTKRHRQQHPIEHRKANNSRWKQPRRGVTEHDSRLDGQHPEFFHECPGRHSRDWPLLCISLGLCSVHRQMRLQNCSVSQRDILLWSWRYPLSSSLAPLGGCINSCESCSWHKECYSMFILFV